MTSVDRQADEMVDLINGVAELQLASRFSQEWYEIVATRALDAGNGSANVRTLGAQAQLVTIDGYARTKLGLSPARFHAALDRRSSTRLIWALNLFSSEMIRFADGVDDSESSPSVEDPTANWGDWEHGRIRRASKLDNPVAHREQAIQTFTSLASRTNKTINATKYCRGIMWLQRAAPYDHLAKSLLASGLSFPDEFDVPQLREGIDPDLITALYLDAANFGLLDAQVNLGMIHTGKFAPFPAQDRARFLDHAKSYAWWRKAADCAQPEAMINLGHMFAQGNAPPCNGAPDETAAYAIWERLSRTGDLRGLFLVAICLANGRGVAHDRPRARAILESIPRLAPHTRLATEAFCMLETLLATPGFVAGNPQAA